MRTDSVPGSRRPRVLGAAVIAALALAAAGCGSSGSPAGAGGPATHHPMAHDTMAAGHSHPMTATFGSDCGMIPASGMGSIHSMSLDPVVTAAAHNPLLTSFAADVKTAGLTGDLTTMHSFTVFAPANSAFSKLTSPQMSMMHSSAELATILKGHIVTGRVTPAELASGMTLNTLAGGSLKGAKMGAVYEVGSAHVICGNIQTTNATVYVIDKVLLPMRH